MDAETRMNVDSYVRGLAGPEVRNAFPGLNDSEVYSSVAKVINELDSDNSRIWGVTFYSSYPDSLPKHPAVELGWAEFKCITHEPRPGKRLRYALVPTDMGVEVMNGYRFARGSISFEDELERNDQERKKWPLNILQ